MQKWIRYHNVCVHIKVNRGHIALHMKPIYGIAQCYCHPTQTDVHPALTAARQTNTNGEQWKSKLSWVVG